MERAKDTGASGASPRRLGTPGHRPWLAWLLTTVAFLAVTLTPSLLGGGYLLWWMAPFFWLGTLVASETARA